MQIAVEIYRNADGEVFFRTSGRTGRTRHFRVEAETSAHLESWLESNGFSRPDGSAPPEAPLRPAWDPAHHGDRPPAG